MKKNLTEIIFIIDRSGSMISIREDMIGGFNAFIQEQQKLPDECKVSCYQFDTGGWGVFNEDNSSVVETLYEEKPLDKVPLLTTETFIPRGGTPLYEAVAIVVKKVGDRLATVEESQRPEKVLVVCITDGEENSSRDWTAKQVKQMIQHQEEKYNWEFVYLGANQDAWAVGGNMGIKSSSTLRYVATSGGTEAMFASLSSKTMHYRASSELSKGIGFDDADKEAQEKEGLNT